MLGYDCYAVSTNFGEVDAKLEQADDVVGAQVAMDVLAIAAMLALLFCYCFFEPDETAINRGKVQLYLSYRGPQFVCDILDPLRDSQA